MISHVLASQLREAATLWQEIELSLVPADRFLGNYFHRFRSKFGSRDRRVLSEITYALFRHKTFLRSWLDEYKLSNKPVAAVILAAVLEEILDQQTFNNAFAEFVRPIELDRCWQSLKNHALPSHLKIKSEKEKWSYHYSFPLWLIERWVDQYGAERCEKLLAVTLQRPALIIRTNLHKISRDTLIQHLQKKGYDVMPTSLSKTGIIFPKRINVFELEEFKKGWFEIQDEGSQWLCERMNPEPGEILWDICAGGGGKSLALSALMQNKGRIVATDIRVKKLEDLKKRAKRAGAFNIFPADMNRMTELRAARHGFDKILVDAPCSGTGTLRRNPDAKWKLKPEDFKRFHQEQLSILESAWQCLKPGGLLFYVTCSIDREENEATIQAFLKKIPEAMLVPQKEGDTLQLFPEKNKTDGFFLGVIKKKNYFPGEAEGEGDGEGFSQGSLEQY